MTSVKASLRKSRTLSPHLFTFLAFVFFVVLFYALNYSSSVSEEFSSVSSSSADQRISSSDRVSDSVSSVSRAELSSVSTSSVDQRLSSSDTVSDSVSPVSREEEKIEEEELLPFATGRAPEGCDVFSGSWVRDESTRPLYQESECRYIQPQLTCQEHGRPDRGYQYWRWQPHDCNLPSFNATMMLESLRGKRLMFVGDSLNRGQYVSLICLLQSVIPEGSKSMEDSYDSLTIFRAKDYNATIEFYWAPFLLESNSDNAIVHRITDRIVRKGSINKHGKYWKGADIVVFNTYLWWITGRKMKVLKGSFNDEKKEIIELETEDAYRMAMKSMVNWVQRNMDLQKTRVFFTSMSPTHTKSQEWGGNPNGNCYNETTLIDDPTYWGTDSMRSIMQVIGEVFTKTKAPVSFLNITQLSSYRKDAHTSIYKKQWNPLTPEQTANPSSYADCTHWCLPGLQDTWNELLYAKLFYP